jgi:hypothetical protein
MTRLMSPASRSIRNCVIVTARAAGHFSCKLRIELPENQMVEMLDIEGLCTRFGARI